MQLTLTYKKVFGNDLYYPGDCESAVICELIGSKSFASWQVEKMKKAGWTLDIKAEIPS